MASLSSFNTTLAKQLSSIASTAAFDKNPQSQTRGITLDLGFSGYFTQVPTHWQEHGIDTEQILVTLVDCPGHASLVRTVIGGAQIIDVTLLVIDATKGIQTQTAECLVLAQIIKCPLVIALNKIDLLQEATRSTKIAKIKQAIAKAILPLGFEHVPMIPVSAQNDDAASNGIDQLVHALRAPFLYAVDHCFALKGKGTILTGTILGGAVNVGDVKSIQRFRQSIERACKGDRIGICILERGLVATPNVVQLTYAAIVDAQRIPFYKVTVGYETVTANVVFFSRNNNDGNSKYTFDLHEWYQFLPTLEQEEEDNNEATMSSVNTSKYWALLEFDKPIRCAPRALSILSRLDLDIRILSYSYSLYSCKRQRTAMIDRIVDDYTLIGRGLVRKEGTLDKFIGLTVTIGSSGNLNTIYLHSS
ncbi:elongation factor Tu GTP binding domain-containing protein [Syncephalis plumigaleata]|nr:elongation factor Tu GTP binding domain-containing protein [Syncephalis plumigaleata]